MQINIKKAADKQQTTISKRNCPPHQNQIEAKHKVQFFYIDAHKGSSVPLRNESDEIFDVWSGLNLDNGFFYHRFPGE